MVRFATSISTQAAAELGVHPIFSAELTLHDQSHLTLLVQDATGWKNLCRLISLARHNGPKGEARLPKGALANHSAGLIALSGCRQGEIMQALRRGDPKAAAERYRTLLGPERFCIELQNHLLPGDKALIAAGVELAQALGLRCVASNNVHYVQQEQQELEYALLGVTLHEHPMQFYRAALREQQVLGSREVSRCKARTWVKTGGMIVVHQAPPTAKGFHFVTLEDEDGFLNIIVRPNVYVRYRKVLRGTAFILVEGLIERQGLVTNVVAKEIQPIIRR